MNAEAKSLRFLINETKLEIPFFQRPYVWKFENAKNLLEDLLRCDGKHFIGSILLKRTQNKVEGETPYKGVIIDGQQRLTTLSILIKVMLDILSKNGIDAQKKTEGISALFYRENNVYKIHLLNSFLDRANYGEIIGSIEEKQIEGEPILKIISPLEENILEEIKKEPFFSLSDDKIEEIYNNDSNLLRQCYKYFTARLQKCSIEQIKSLWNKLFDDNNKILVLISIEENEQEQEIFDTINSSGMHLSSTDIIKNHLYDKFRVFGLTEKDIYKKYEETWQKTFESDENVNSFWIAEKSVGRNLRDNMELLFQAVGIINKIYNVEEDTLSDLAKKYKEYIDKNLKSVEDIDNFINEIINYADIYKTQIPTFSNSKFYCFNNAKERLACTMDISENTTFTPYVLYLYKTYTDEPEKLNERLNLLDTILMHYIITGASNKNFNKYCNVIIEKDKKGNSELLDYVKNEIDSFKEDDIFKGIKKKKNNKLAKLILFWIELHRKGLNEKSDETSVGLQFTKEMELEHLMPQTWETEPAWSNLQYIDEKGNKINDIEEGIKNRKEMVLSLGNMTILRKKLNSSISNASFYVKINGKQGAKKRIEGIRDCSKFSITTEVIPNESIPEKDYLWNEKTIHDREIKLGHEILTIWPIIQ